MQLLDDGQAEYCAQYCGVQAQERIEAILSTLVKPQESQPCLTKNGTPAKLKTHASMTTAIGVTD